MWKSTEEIRVKTNIKYVHDPLSRSGLNPVLNHFIILMVLIPVLSHKVVSKKLPCLSKSQLLEAKIWSFCGNYVSGSRSYSKMLHFYIRIIGIPVSEIHKMLFGLTQNIKPSENTAANTLAHPLQNNGYVPEGQVSS